MSLKLQYRRGEEEHGSGPIIHRWRPNGHTVAVACANNTVIYYDKKGNVIDALNPTGKLIDIAWDKEGDVLAIAVANTGTIYLWDVNSRNTDTVESGATSSKELPTCLAWSPSTPTLVIGNNAGNIVVYNHRTSRRIAVMGKHQRSVTQITVTPEDYVISCSDDNTLSVTTLEGTTVSTTTTNGEPTNMDYGSVNGKGGSGVTMVSVVIGKKILMLAHYNALDEPVNLQFQEKYGNIHSYRWFNDGYILIGFDRGYIISISAHNNEIGSELVSFLEYRGYLASIAVSTSFNKLLTIGDNMVKVRDLDELTTVTMLTEIETEKNLSEIEVTEDGQLVAVSSQSGVLSIFVTKMPTLAASYNNSICYLTNLTQVTVVAEVEKKGSSTLELNIEPTVMGLGPLNLAVANNNTVFFYDYHTPAQMQAAQQLQSTQSAAEKPTIVAAEPINRVEYLSTVTNIQLNYMYAAVNFGSRLRLHRIRNSEDNVSIEFPEANRNATLYSYALTENFLIFTTSNNYIVYFSLSEWAIVSEYRHVVPVRSIFPHPTNVVCCCFDDRLEAMIYSAVDDEVFRLPSVGSSAHYKGAIWETFTIDKNTFAVFDSQNIYVFLLSKQHIQGESVIYVSATRLPHAYVPLSLNKGIVTCLMSNGKLSSVLLDSHKTESVISDKSETVIDDILTRSLLMHRWSTAWKICIHSNDGSHWNQFAMAALLDSDVGMAIKIFREIGDAAMVTALELIETIEEKNLLHAQIYTILSRYDDAEQLYLESSRPMEALNMRRDLLEWPKALVLAETMNPKEIPYLSKEYAQELELTGDHANSLANYEKGVMENPQNLPELQEHNEICQSGIARMAIKTGDLRRGVQLAKQLEGRVVKRDCAIILEQMKQYTEAAQLYEVGLFYDRAAAVCLKANAWAKVGELLDHVKSPKIHIQYGKIMEKEKKYKVAVKCYETGRDYDNQVRLLLDPLNDPDEAVRVVRESRSIEGAKLVAKFFVKLGDYNSAIQFLVMSQCVQEAFELAEKNNAVREYAKAIEQHGNISQALELAEYYNRVNDMFMAAKFYTQAGQYNNAINLLFKNGDDENCVALAVDCGIKSKDKTLNNKLVKFLLGEDGNVKDPAQLFRLYVGLGRTKDAAQTAVVVAQIHQAKGNYRIARDLLFQMHQQLREKMMRIPLDMNKSLMAIHSYIIVKALINRKETLLAARLLIRTCGEIQRFPTHVVPILTSSVVICTQANLKKSAHKFAAQLMTPEYRPKIHEKYKKKIEDIVRKGGNQKDLVEENTPCPICDDLMPAYAMSCDNCKSLVPYCILTGRHIVASDFSRCPHCEMPGFYSEFRKLSILNENCYMCGGDLKGAIPEDAKAYLEKMEQDYK
ncbi:WD repeat-containing protein dyf-2 [Caenorhabditis elegans]|uniref:WD repeat-containing protein dyf-2 n=1 Tax=Caenorhabditis elegans TaxID=6239 RepID=A0ACB0DP95_CAEEL|nr:WD repeat-containing protein dyf-2 [Caenorhabditis elegans]CAI9647951.1 WD repeat-containing protein dyf-2 [Caenorhabditis elegans]